LRIETLSANPAVLTGAWVTVGTATEAFMTVFSTR
jgi:hypothetical protein